MNIEERLDSEFLKTLKRENGFIYVPDINNRIHKIRLSKLPKDTRNYIPQKWSKQLQQKFPELNQKQYYIEYTIFRSPNLKQAYEQGFLSVYFNGRQCYPEIKNIYGRTFVSDLRVIKDFTIEDFRNFIPYRWTSKIQEKYPELTQKEFFIEYNLMLRDDWNVIKECLDDKIIELIPRGTNFDILVHTSYGIDYQLQLHHELPKSVEEYLNYEPYTYKKSMNISREEFLLRLINRSSRSQEIIKAIELGRMRIYNNKYQIKDIYDKWWYVQLHQLPKDLINWYGPKMYKEFYDISRHEFIIKYGLRNSYNEEDYQKLMVLYEEGILDFDNNEKNILYKIKCCDTKNVKILYHIPIPIDIEWFRNFREYYYRLTTEEIAEKIELLSDSPTRKEYLKLKAKVKKWANATPEDVERLEEIAVELGIDIEIHNGFIMKYDEAKEIMDGDVKLEVFKEPIVLTEENLEEMILDHSIVWDLYDVEEEKSIYVGECRSGQYELEALKLYVNQDKEGTIKRRSKEYGYEGNQPIIERIFGRNFVARLLAV